LSDPRNLSYLVRNIATNACTNVVVESKAVADKKGSASLIAEPDSEKSYLSVTQDQTPLMVVETITLDDFFAEAGWPPIGLVKMDIEGSEGAALAGMRELSRRSPEMRLIMEFNLMSMQRAGTSRNELLDLLMDLGFRRGHIIEQGMKPFSLPDGFPNTQAVYNLLLVKE